MKPHSTIVNTDNSNATTCKHSPSNPHNPIVISNGYQTLKYGFCDMTSPKTFQLTSTSTKRWHYQDPIQDGLIADWYKIENIWNNIFQHQLTIDAKYYDILLTECVRNSSTNTHRIIDILFDKFNVNSVCILDENVLALFALNRYNGVVMNLAYHNTDCVPIMNGKVILNAVKQFHNKSNNYNYSKQTLFDNGIHKIFYKSVKKCDESLREELLSNIVIYGIELLDDEVITNDFDKRLGEMIKDLFINKGYAEYNVNVITPANRENLSWFGGANFCKQNVITRDLWISNHEWKEADNNQKWGLSKSISNAYANEFLKFIGIAYIHQLSLYSQTPIDIIRCILFCCNGVVYQDFELVIDL